MTEEQIEQKAEEYSDAFIEKGVAKASFIKGIKFGLKQHSHDYLVKTINLKKKYKKQIEELKMQSVICEEGLKKRIAELEAQIEKMKRCEICKHQSSISGCSYHSISVKDCKENGMKLFELKEIKEK